MIYIYANLKAITERFGGDTYCAGCNRMLINTKYYDGLQPTMPAITEDDLRFAGLPPERLAGGSSPTAYPGAETLMPLPRLVPIRARICR